MNDPSAEQRDEDQLLLWLVDMVSLAGRFHLQH